MMSYSRHHESVAPYTELRVLVSQRMCKKREAKSNAQHQCIQMQVRPITQVTECKKVWEAST